MNVGCCYGYTAVCQLWKYCWQVRWKFSYFMTLETFNAVSVTSAFVFQFSCDPKLAYVDKTFGYQTL